MKLVPSGKNIATSGGVLGKTNVFFCTLIGLEHVYDS